MSRFYVGQRVVWWANNQRALATVVSVNHDYGNVTIAVSFRNRHEQHRVYRTAVLPSALLVAAHNVARHIAGE
jgi:hypothetical protein